MDGACFFFFFVVGTKFQNFSLAPSLSVVSSGFSFSFFFFFFFVVVAAWCCLVTIRRAEFYRKSRILMKCDADARD